MTPAELCLHYVSPMLYRATTQKIIADSYLWALRDNYSELRAENDHLRNALDQMFMAASPGDVALHIGRVLYSGYISAWHEGYKTGFETKAPTEADILYKNAIWRLHDLMDQIREAQNDDNTGDASDLAHEARPLFQLFPDQPDTRTYAEKSRAGLIATGKFTGEEIDAIRAQLTQNPHFQRTDTP